LKGLALSRRTPAIVDFGPLHMRSGGDDQSCRGFLEGANEMDVARLEALLSGSGMPHQQSRDFHDEHLDFHTSSVSTSDEPSQLYKLSQELSTAAEQIATHANLELQGESFKGIYLTVFEMEGRLHFDLVIKDEKHKVWLSHQLQNLANELGDRLKRTIRIQFIDGSDTDSVVIRADWNEMDSF
jgi:hypothetical protein